MNPYSFKNYLKEVLQIYMNPMKNLKEKAEYSKMKNNQSINEFGVLITCLLGSFDSNEMLININYRNECLKKLQDNKSEFYELVDFIFNDNYGAKSFKEIKEWVKINKPKSKNKKGLFNYMNTSTKI